MTAPTPGAGAQRTLEEMRWLAAAAVGTMEGAGVQRRQLAPLLRLIEAIDRERLALAREAERG